MLEKQQLQAEYKNMRDENAQMKQHFHGVQDQMMAHMQKNHSRASTAAICQYTCSTTTVATAHGMENNHEDSIRCIFTEFNFHVLMFYLTNKLSLFMLEKIDVPYLLSVPNEKPQVLNVT